MLRAEPDGSFLRLRDVAKVDLGAQDYKSFSRLTRKPAALLIVYLSPGANAVETADRVLAYLSEAKKTFPQGIDYTVGYDATKFVRAAIRDVIETLIIAIVLVILVVFCVSAELARDADSAGDSAGCDRRHVRAVSLSASPSI